MCVRVRACVSACVCACVGGRVLIRHKHTHTFESSWTVGAKPLPQTKKHYTHLGYHKKKKTHLCSITTRRPGPLPHTHHTHSVARHTPKLPTHNRMIHNCVCVCGCGCGCGCVGEWVGAFCLFYFFYFI